MFDRRIFREAGRTAALNLRSEAAGLTGTEIIDREQDAPDFDPTKDYSSWPVGAPVADEFQVWTLIQPHNAAHYPGGRPATLRALWALAHTKDPTKAKPWVDPYGTSGMYMQDECYVDSNRAVFRSKRDNVVFPASVQPDDWEAVVWE
ncbi:MAG: hypothetical protein J6K73_04925 [Clostridia bacterium]|nr:hypothetical protein [Clostridia bacterium]